MAIGGRTEQIGADRCGPPRRRELGVGAADLTGRSTGPIHAERRGERVNVEGSADSLQNCSSYGKRSDERSRSRNTPDTQHATGRSG